MDHKKIPPQMWQSAASMRGLLDRLGGAAAANLSWGWRTDSAILAGPVFAARVGTATGCRPAARLHAPHGLPHHGPWVGGWSNGHDGRN